jgi:hypothetical protein
MAGIVKRTQFFGLVAWTVSAAIAGCAAAD